jgi:hypothetical protein
MVKQSHARRLPYSELHAMNADGRSDVKNPGLLQSNDLVGDFCTSEWSR